MQIIATVCAKVFEHHRKADSTFNVKYIVYHNGTRKHIGSPHFVSNRLLSLGVKEHIELLEIAVKSWSMLSGPFFSDILFCQYKIDIGVVHLACFPCV